MGTMCVYSNDEVYDDYSDITKPLEDFESTYELGSTLGVGEFSEVRKAESNLGPVAVKCIKLSVIRNELHLLKREISIMIKVKHPNVLELFGIYENSEFVYLTMELCLDGNLKEMVMKSGPLSTDYIREISKKILKALSYLHSMKVCHRDIKPENILFKGKEPKLADFGLARLMDGTSKFSMVGTPYYLAPEVISGEYNMKCDIWSLGVVLFYAATGRKPFVADGHEELFEKIQDSEIDWEGVNEDLQDFLRFLLKKNHQLRPDANDAMDHVWMKGV